MHEKKINAKYVITADGLLIDHLQAKTLLSKEKLKKAIDYGCVRLQMGGKGTQKRLRKVKAVVKAKDTLLFNYDPYFFVSERFKQQEKLLEKCLPVFETKDYGAWYKSANIITQGNEYGDGHSLLRKVEKQKGKAFLLQRLDVETSGLLIFPYDKEAARRLSVMIQQHHIKKIYQLKTRAPWTLALRGTMEDELDGDSAVLKYELKREQDGISFIEVELVTGRLHQIRRQFAKRGFPVLGDKKYGLSGEYGPLALVSYKIEFRDPFSDEKRMIELPPALRLFT